MVLDWELLKAPITCVEGRNLALIFSLLEEGMSTLSHGGDCLPSLGPCQGLLT